MSAQEVQLLPRWLLRLYMMITCLCALSFSFGCLGTFIMADVDKEWAISKSQLADVFWSLLRFNQMAISALVNGSLVVGVICVLNIRNHNTAVRAKLLPHEILKGERLHRFLAENRLEPAKLTQKKAGKKKR